MLAEGPPGTGRCSFHVAGYIPAGGHPTVAQGKKGVTFYFQYGAYTTYTSKNGYVINCGNFYIYYLTDLSPWVNVGCCATVNKSVK